MRPQFFLSGLLVLLFFPFIATAETIVLTSDAVKNTALEKNLEVQLASLDQEIGEQDLPAVQSIYDMTLSARAVHLQDKLERTTIVFGTETNTTNYDISLSQKTPLGTELGLGFLNQRETTDSAFATVNPSFDSEVAMTLRQPVAKNAFGFVDRKKIQLVKKQLEALDYTVKSRIEAAVYKTLTDYWLFYRAHHLGNLANESLAKARKLYDANVRKKEMGLIEPPDLYAFAANHNIQQNNQLITQDLLSSATETIRMDLSFSSGEKPRPGQENFGKKKDSALDEALLQAFETRPDYLALKKEVEALNLKVALNKNSRWPQIDVVSSLTLNGIDNGYGQAVEDIGDGHPAWSVGMEFAFPLQNRASRSDAKKSELERVKKIVELKRKEQEITRQVTEKTAQLKHAEKRLTATRMASDNQYKKMAGEMQKYDRGRSDSDTVIRYQNDYIETKKLALDAEVNYALTALDLEFVTGKLLE